MSTNISITHSACSTLTSNSFTSKRLEAPTKNTLAQNPFRQNSSLKNGIINGFFYLIDFHKVCPLKPVINRFLCRWRNVLKRRHG